MLFLTIFLICFLLQMYFAWFYRTPQGDVLLHHAATVPVTILICAKNESANLQSFLPQVLQQDYKGAWELLVVNDGSTDDTAVILEQFQNQFPQLRVLHLKGDVTKEFPGKKQALLEGLKASKYEAVLLTDADCVPSSISWLNIMAAKYEQLEANATGNKLVLGFGAYASEQSWLNRFVQWETLHTYIQYSSFALRKVPYMGVGRNMMYSKGSVLALFEHDTTFRVKMKQSPSGDDDIIVSTLASDIAVGICSVPQAHTISNPPKTWQAWWKQKTRHVSTGKVYPDSVQRVLGAYALSLALFYGTALILLVSSITLIKLLVLILVACKVFINARQVLKWQRKLGLSNHSQYYWLGEWAWIVYNAAMSPYIFWKNKQQWK